jgi:hypothetical protein
MLFVLRQVHSQLQSLYGGGEGDQQNPKVTAGYLTIKMHTVKVQQKQPVRQSARNAHSTITRHRKQSWGMCTTRNNYSAFADFLLLHHYSLT